LTSTPDQGSGAPYINSLIKSIMGLNLSKVPLNGAKLPPEGPPSDPQDLLNII